MAISLKSWGEGAPPAADLPEAASVPAPPEGGKRLVARLPERMQAAMKAQQESSEILIGWLQLIVVLGFGSLYLISPKGYPPEVEFRPIPWVLGAYLGILGTRYGTLSY